jgi:hypothetical protein
MAGPLSGGKRLGASLVVLHDAEGDFRQRQGGVWRASSSEPSAGQPRMVGRKGVADHFAESGRAWDERQGQLDFDIRAVIGRRKYELVSVPLVFARLLPVAVGKQFNRHEARNCPSRLEAFKGSVHIPHYRNSVSDESHIPSSSRRELNRCPSDVGRST